MRAIHELITSDFNPLELCTKLAPLFQRLAEISTPLSPAAPIKDVALASYTTSLKQVRASPHLCGMHAAEEEEWQT